MPSTSAPRSAARVDAERAGAVPAPVDPPAAERAASRRKPAAVRRAEIADAAERIAREDGLAAITMRAVGARVGIAPTLVVHHAESMDALVSAAFVRIVSAELADMETLVEGEADPHAALHAVLTAALADTGAEVTRVWVEAWAFGPANEPLAEAAREQMDAWRGFLAGLIERGIAAGRYRDVEPRAVAGQVLGMIDGISAHSLVGWQDGAHRVELMLRAVDAMLGVPSGVDSAGTVREAGSAAADG